MNEEILYDVVINDEEQYSIWETITAPPSGWIKTGFSGSKKACLGHIEKVWTDMRPLSLRKQLHSLNNNFRVFKRESELKSPSLVDQLTKAESHFVTLINNCPQKTEFKDTLLSGVCYIKFINIENQPELALFLKGDYEELSESTIGFKGELFIDQVFLKYWCKLNLINFEGTCNVEKNHENIG